MDDMTFSKLVQLARILFSTVCVVLVMSGCSAGRVETVGPTFGQNVIARDAAAQSVLTLLIEDPDAQELIDDVNEIAIAGGVVRVTVDVAQISGTDSVNDACETIFTAIESTTYDGVEILDSIGYTMSRRLDSDGGIECSGTQ